MSGCVFNKNTIIEHIRTSVFHHYNFIRAHGMHASTSFTRSTRPNAVFSILTH